MKIQLFVFSSIMLLIIILLIFPSLSNITFISNKIFNVLIFMTNKYIHLFDLNY